MAALWGHRSALESAESPGPGVTRSPTRSRSAPGPERLAYADLHRGRYPSAWMHASEGLRREGECRSSAVEAIERAHERWAGLILVLATWVSVCRGSGSGEPRQPWQRSSRRCREQPR
jgi:hypothetical protein